MLNTTVFCRLKNTNPYHLREGKKSSSKLKEQSLMSKELPRPEHLFFLVLELKERTSFKHTS